MKSINIIFFASVCAMAVLFPSCDILDTKPEDFNSFNNFYKTEEQIYNTLATCYAPLATYNSYGGQLVFEAIMDDLMYWNWKSTPSSMINRTYGWNYNSSNADIEAMWNNLYFGIERSNLLLENIDGAEMDDELRETYRAEAAFLRAYYHFLLNVYWGDIPLKNKSLENVGAVNNPRTPTAEVTNFIITEMERAANSGKLIAADKYNHAARITQTAVEAILAKVCLKAAGYPLNLGEPMYRKALEYALRVKESGIHRLNPVYEQLFINQASDVYDNVYRESIWEAEFVGNSVTNPGRSTGYSMIGSRICILSSESDNIG
jgi:uncharacterized protein (DUF952 family)